jgi:hydroxymethylpyrimidine/phosphomethylpyrimidine kinase
MQVLPDMPVVLTIAGFDPSGCAGILADIKTFESNGVYGMAVCTANTEQNVSEFKKPNWIKEDEILGQLSLLMKEVKFEFIKIGLVKNLAVLDMLVSQLIKANPIAKIIWDPVCKASAGFEFHDDFAKGELERVCKELYLVTPNLDEMRVITPGNSIDAGAKYLAQYCNVLVKGGHSISNESTDILFTKEGIQYFEAERLQGFAKRGTGCVLSAAMLKSMFNII